MPYGFWNESFLFTIYHLLFTPVPSRPSGFPGSTSNTVAAAPSSLPRSLLAASLALRQTDLHVRRACAATARLAGAGEISDPIASTAVFATAPCHRQLALQSLHRLPLRAPLSERSHKCCRLCA